MIKLIGLLLFCLSHSAFASQDAALASVDALKKALEQFNPSEALNGFTETPAESLLKPQENDDGLKNQGIAAMQENEEANYLYMNEKTRTKAIVNRESTEMQYAKQLIEGSESVKEGGCIASAPKCSEEVSTETCEDIAHYAPKSCESKLQVRLNSKLHTVHRQVIGLRVQKPFDLAHCGDSMRLGCQTLDEVHLSPDCYLAYANVR